MAALAGGCATQPDPFVPVRREAVTIQWQREGDVRRRAGTLERSNDGAVRVVLSPGPTVTLTAAEILETPDWRGHAGEAPGRWSVWAGFLGVCRHAGQIADGDREMHAPGRRIAVQKSDGTLRAVAVVNLDTGESLAVGFSRLPEPPGD